MGRRRQVIAVTHQRPNGPPVEADRSQVAFPAHSIQGIEGVTDQADLLATLDPDLPGRVSLLGLECLINVRCLQGCRVKDCMRTQESLVG